MTAHQWEGEMDLPVISSCDGCGACCTMIKSPPGFAAVFKSAIRDCVMHPDDLPNPTDVAIVAAMPVELRDELANYYLDSAPPGNGAGQPWCIWYDDVTKRCRHHEHRPTVCREFEMGSRECRSVRGEFGIE